MAAPEVSGVAALAWAIDPNASVATVRNAILEGADPDAALKGKVACGGSLDAYKTLELLGGKPLCGPTVGSLSALSSTVAAGAALTLSASGIQDSGGTVTQVLFYRDADGNGVYDSGDPLVGSTSTISNGSATVAVNTSGLAGGSYDYFAKAVDNLGQTSAAAGTAVTILPADDYGDSAATAKAIVAPTAIDATLGFAGDTNWFSFQAAAGTTYTCTTTLGTLRNSILYLYGSNGKTQLAMNDDYGGSPASRIVWTAAAGGTYYIEAAGYGNYTGAYMLTVQTSTAGPTPNPSPTPAPSPSPAPVLTPIADQTLTATQTTLSLTLGATDPGRGRLQWSAEALTNRAGSFNAGADDRHECRREHGRQPAGDQSRSRLYPGVLGPCHGNRRAAGGERDVLRVHSRGSRSGGQGAVVRSGARRPLRRAPRRPPLSPSSALRRPRAL